MGLFDISFKKTSTPSKNTGGLFGSMYSNTGQINETKNKFGIFSNLTQYHGIVRWQDIIGKPSWVNTNTAIWGGITGTITNQTDLISYLTSNYYPLNSNPASYLTSITGTMVTNALGYTPYNSSNPSNYITISALTGYATETWVNNNFYAASNPSGYITSSALSPYLTSATAALTYQPIGTYATASNSMTFTNKGGNISMWTNDSGYITSSALSGYLLASTAALTYVPYINATANLDLGNYDLNAQGIKITGTAGNGHLTLRWQSVDPTSAGNHTTFFANSVGDFKYKIDGNYYTTFSTYANTADRVYTFPDRSITIDNITTSTTTSGTGFLKGNGSVISFDNSTYLTSVSGTTNRISVSGGNTIDIDGAYVGQTSITTVSSTTGITTGVWKATIIDPTYGGTGVNNGTKTITLGGSLTTSGTATPTLAFGNSTYTYTFPLATSTLLANNLGISGGTTLVGDTASSGNLTLSSTSNATKGNIVFGTSKYDEVKNRLGLGMTPTYRLDITQTIDHTTPDTSTYRGANITITSSTQPLGALITLYGLVVTNSIQSQTSDTRYGILGQVTNTDGNGTAIGIRGYGIGSNVNYGGYFEAHGNSTANRTHIGIYAITGNYNASNSIGIAGKFQVNKNPTSGRGVGVEINYNDTTADITYEYLINGQYLGNTVWSVRSNGNTFIGGTTKPTARLHIAAGTATAGTAPLKLTSGTNLTTPENGAFEYDGTNLYFTTGGTRKTVTLV